VAYLVTGPAVGAGSSWVFEQEPMRDRYVDPLLVIAVVSRTAPVVPASRWGP
jgi:hypothetical protein